MKNYVKSFLLRGMAFSGFGPIILGIIYVILQNTVTDFSLTGKEVFIGIISTYILAFMQAGASVFNQIEEWPITKSTFFHFFTIYISYTICYLVNTWIPFKPQILLIFTLIFITVYIIVWLTVFISLKLLSKKMNRLI